MNDNADIPDVYAPMRNRFIIGRLMGITLTKSVVKIAEPKTEIPNAVSLETMLFIRHYCLKAIGYTDFSSSIVDIFALEILSKYFSISSSSCPVRKHSTMLSILSILPNPVFAI